MNILITGANGFIGKHMVLAAKRRGHSVFSFDLNNTEEDLIKYIFEADFIIHLAGVNRPLTIEEFYDGNTNFTKHLVDLVLMFNKDIPIIMSSSIQASLDNDYGKSKKMGEDYLFNSGLRVYIYRLANVFGKWCKPNYNSVCATFCYNIAHELPIKINEPNHVVHFNYIDDICDEFLNVVEGKKVIKNTQETLSLYPIYDCKLSTLANLLYYFKSEIESKRHLPIIKNQFELKLFKTFCDYFSDDGYSFNYSKDERGSFEEIFKSKKYGQISDNITHVGITKGGHYHTYKKEIFYTVIGQSEIRQRHIEKDDIISEYVSGSEPKMVEIIPYYTHDITNIGSIDSHTIMWISEIYSPETADTYREDVVKNIDEEQLN